MFRESAGLELRVDERSVDVDVEDASAAGDQLGLDAELLLDLCRQTGGFWLVVSGRAVFDLHFHGVDPVEFG